MVSITKWCICHRNLRTNGKVSRSSACSKKVTLSIGNKLGVRTKIKCCEKRNPYLPWRSSCRRVHCRKGRAGSGHRRSRHAVACGWYTEPRGSRVCWHMSPTRWQAATALILGGKKLWSVLYMSQIFIIVYHIVVGFIIAIFPVNLCFPITGG